MTAASPDHIAYLHTRCRRYPGWLPASIRSRCRTIWPWIFMGDAYWQDPTHPFWPPVLTHEWEHIEQESEGPRWVPVALRTLWFLACEYTRKRPRLEAETEGVAAEIENASGEFRMGIWNSYLEELCGDSYGHAAKDAVEAAAAIRRALAARGCLWAPEA